MLIFFYEYNKPHQQLQLQFHVSFCTPCERWWWCWWCDWWWRWWWCKNIQVCRSFMSSVYHLIYYGGILESPSSPSDIPNVIVKLNSIRRFLRGNLCHADDDLTSISWTVYTLELSQFILLIPPFRWKFSASGIFCQH